MCCHEDDITIILENGKVENFCPDFDENFGKFLEKSQKFIKNLGFL